MIRSSYSSSGVHVKAEVKVERKPVKVQLKEEKKEIKDEKGRVKQEAKSERKVTPEGGGLTIEGLIRRAQELGRQARSQAAKRPKGPKRKVTAARRKASREQMNRKVGLSEELSELLGTPALSRPEVTKRIWAYAKEQNLLDPANKREIVCDEPLQRVLGVDRATLFSLPSHLMPHFDYSYKEEEPKPVKRKKEAKAEMKREVKRAKKEEPAVKEEKPSVKREAVKILKSEAQGPVAQSDVAVDLEAPAAKIQVELSQIRLTALRLQVRDPELGPGVKFFAQATPCAASKLEDEDVAGLLVPCKPEFCETATGLEQFWVATIEGLEPTCSYRVSVELRAVRGKRISRATTPEVIIPQRAAPYRWSLSEVQLFISSLDVPEVAAKVLKYGIDGSTFMALGEDDLQGFGVAPAAARQVLAALQDLKAPAPTRSKRELGTGL